MDVKVNNIIGSSAFSEFIIENYVGAYSENYFRGTQNVGTSEESLELGDVPSVDLLMVTNMDATNFVQLYNISGGTPFAKIMPGQTAVLPTAVSTLYVKADTAACRIKILAFEN